MKKARALSFLMQKNNWWIFLLIIFVISLSGVLLIGVQTYHEAPPIPDFVRESGEVVVSQNSILEGQTLFQKYALMNYGSMFGDGAGRGPDYTAEALHKTAVYMKEYYLKRLDGQPKDSSYELQKEGIDLKVQKEIKKNRYIPEKNQVALSEAQILAYQNLVAYYSSVFRDGARKDSFRPARYINNLEEIQHLTSFFFWGGWVCGVERPEKSYSYTHNWPYDPEAGNLPTSAVLLWSIFGALGLILGLGIVLYFYGQMDQLSNETFTASAGAALDEEYLNKFKPTPTQRATFRFFFAAIAIFFLQVIAGVLTVHDFLGFVEFFGYDISIDLPITIVRSWHLQLSLYWISACWMGASIFILPMISKQEPKGQLFLVNLLFGATALLVAGAFVGIFMGPKGMLGEWWRILGNQGWEFVELGKLWQGLLFAIFGLWAVIVYRGVKPSLQGKDPWALPNWLFYAIACILLLFISGFVAGPKTNFVIADFWRWCVIHMWVESFFEVFTTVIVGYFMVLMGMVSLQSAVRVVYLATLLFLGSGLLGISHNFYWNAKPVATLAVGSVFSTLQVVPLILLTLEAWRFSQMPHLNGSEKEEEKKTFPFHGIFLFLLGVNFWNFFGAGVFGFIINLPIVNYYEHGTYLTVNHGHAALMGVYGNLSIGALLFCCRHLFPPSRWNERWIKISFWSINLGLVLMVLLDLFPAGIYQIISVLDYGLWYSRSQEFILGSKFQTLTWMRAVGGVMFFVGGVIPLVLFIFTRTFSVKPSAPMKEQEK